MGDDRRRLLVVSHVLPFPRAAGQNQRVHYTLVGLRQRFRLGFLTFALASEVESTRRKLLEWVDDPIVLPSTREKSAASRVWNRAAGGVYMASTGLKTSNYVIGELEFSPRRLEKLDLSGYDAALFEYWHAWKSASVFRRRGILTVLDMHDVLWKSYERRLYDDLVAPAAWKRFALRRYRDREEASWSAFDGVIAINREEEQYARARTGESTRMFYAPMGTDLSLWPYGPERPEPPRLAFYGGMSTSRNQDSARRCVEKIMPLVWRRHPGVEFWIVGGKPPESIQQLARDPRIKVTGFVEQVQDVLKTMTAILCPWSGTFGFRSRLIEAMAVGAPVVATPDATAGMELDHEQGVLYGDDDQQLADLTIRLLDEPDYAAEQSRLARSRVEALYGFDATYGKLTRELAGWIDQAKGETGDVS